MQRGRLLPPTILLSLGNFADSHYTDLSAMHKEMHALISQLTAEEKAIILLWLDDMSYDEIAGIVGCARNTLATRLRRIKEKIVRLSNK